MIPLERRSRHRGRRVAKMLLVVLACIPVAMVANGNLALTPSLRLSYRPGRLALQVVPLDGANLVRTADPTITWRIMSAAFPFAIHIPRLLESVTVHLHMHNVNAAVISLTAFELPTLGNKSILVDVPLLNGLDWPHQTSNGVTLWQRPNRSVKTGSGTTVIPIRQYASVEELFATHPAASSIAVAGVDPMAVVTIPHYQPANNPLTSADTFRGHQQIYLYAANEDLHVSFDLVDLNRTRQPSPLSIIVRRADDNSTPLLRRTISDDGVTNGKSITGRARHVDILLPHVSAGVYRLDLNGSDDLTLTNLTSWQHFLSFASRLYLAEGPSYIPRADWSPTTVMTNGQSITLAADHQGAVQTVTVGSRKYKLTAVRQPTAISGLTGTTTLTIPKPDAVVTSDQLLTVTPFFLLPVGAQSLNFYPSPLLDRYDYIVAQYVPRASMQPIAISQTYPIRDLQLFAPNGKSLHFQIFINGLSENNYEVGLDAIDVTLHRGPFPWQKIFSRLIHFTSRS